MAFAIIGCGNMGSCIARRLQQEKLFLYDRHRDRVEKLAKETAHTACHTLSEAVAGADAIILAIKPQHFAEFAKELKPLLQKRHKIISLLAGVQVTTLKKMLSHHDCIRMMPNMAALYGEGSIAFCGTEVSQKEQGDIFKSFAPLGNRYWIVEKDMDAFTALTSSGPAFFFSMIDSMVEAGIAMGFSREVSYELVMQMLQGSITLLKKSEKSCAELSSSIASPGGTTMAGLEEYKKGRVGEGICRVFLAAYQRSQALSEQVIEQNKKNT